MMSDAIEKQRSELLHRFIEKDVREKVLGVTIKQKSKPVNHYLGKTAKSAHKNRLGTVHIVHNVSHKALCNQTIKITDKVDLLTESIPMCKACMKIYNTFNGEKIV